MSRTKPCHWPSGRMLRVHLDRQPGAVLAPQQPLVGLRLPLEHGCLRPHQAVCVIRGNEFEDGPADDLVAPIAEHRASRGVDVGVSAFDVGHEDPIGASSSKACIPAWLSGAEPCNGTAASCMLEALARGLATSLSARERWFWRDVNQGMALLPRLQLSSGPGPQRGGHRVALVACFPFWDLGATLLSSAAHTENGPEGPLSSPGRRGTTPAARLRC